MTSKEKAEELVSKYYQEIAYSFYPEGTSKDCALILVNELLGYMGADRGTEFWLQVKSEINKL